MLFSNLCYIIECMNMILSSETNPQFMHQFSECYLLTARTTRPCNFQIACPPHKASYIWQVRWLNFLPWWNEKYNVNPRRSFIDFSPMIHDCLHQKRKKNHHGYLLEVWVRTVNAGFLTDPTCREGTMNIPKIMWRAQR